MVDNIHTLPAFLTKMLQMVNGNEASIVRWHSSGHSVLIKDVDKFTDEILPKYFKMKKFSSFVRQLNLYGFRKVTSEIDPNQCEFFHQYFKQGKIELLRHIIRRTKVKDLSKSDLPSCGHDKQIKDLNDIINTLKLELQQQQQQYQKLQQDFNLLKQSAQTPLSPSLQSLPPALMVSDVLPPYIVNQRAKIEDDNSFFDALSPLIDDHNRISYLVNLNQIC